MADTKTPNYQNPENHPHADEMADVAERHLQRHWGFGPVTLGSVRIVKGHAVVQMVASGWDPPGALVDRPGLHGANNVDHTHGSTKQEIGLQLLAWHEGAETTKDGVGIDRTILDDPQRLAADPRPIRLGPPAMLLREKARRKETGGSGEVIEYSWALSFPMNPIAPDPVLMNYLLRREKRCLSFHLTQYVIPAFIADLMPKKKGKKKEAEAAPPPPDTQGDLLEQASAPPTTTLDLSDTTMADKIQAEAAAELAGDADSGDRAEVVPIGKAKGKKAAIAPAGSATKDAG